MASAVAELIPTGSLYEITDHLQALFDTMELIDSPELKKEAEADIARYLEAEVRKVDGVAGYLAQCETQQLAAKTEIERLRARAALWEAREERVRKYTQDVMERFELKKLEGHTATFLLRAVPASVVITDEAAIPEEFKRTTVTVSVDKVAIKKAINGGADVAGADLSMGKQTLVRKVAMHDRTQSEIEEMETALDLLHDDYDDDPREHEPACTCTRIDVDQYDARGCEFHDPRSEWRKACAARDRSERVPTTAPVYQNMSDIGCSDDDAPF